MTSILHVIDRTCNETQLQILNVLKTRSASEDGRHTICSIDSAMSRRASVHLGEHVPLVARRFWRVINWAPSLKRFAHSTCSRMIHAWGADAAAACTVRVPDLPVVMTLLDGDASLDVAKWIRSFPTLTTVVVGSQAIRSRLISFGIESENVVVIRGYADFGAINRARQENIRRKVAGEAKPVILMNGPASRAGGEFLGLWASAIVKKIHQDLTVLLPYESKERRRLLRFAESMGMPSLVTLPDPRLTWPELAACADLFLIPADGEVCTEAVGTAMAAGVVVVGTAVRSTAEIIADRSNGLLVKNANPKDLAARIMTALGDETLRRTLTDAAKSQAFEVFGIRDFVDNYSHVYQNLFSGRPAGNDVRDTAMVA